ncbi:hypothetical protein PV325_011692 [Microctonus aethiopoides]|nr:hypothetical protein PV325_011692 [Microctonus aethiopoides]
MLFRLSRLPGYARTGGDASARGPAVSTLELGNRVISPLECQRAIPKGRKVCCLKATLGNDSPAGVPTGRTPRGTRVSAAASCRLTWRIRDGPDKNCWFSDEIPYEVALKKTVISRS